MKVDIIADSIWEGVRITTVEVNFPRIILSQILTHRAFSRNTQSSRAMPVRAMIDSVKSNPYTPNFRYAKAKGMQPGGVMDAQPASFCEGQWEIAIENAINTAEMLLYHGCAKEIANRVLEPFMHIKMLITATEWDNFFRLRCDDAAQEEIKDLACAMRDAMKDNTPVERYYHTPFIAEGEHPAEPATHWACVGRCARISYNRHDGTFDPQADIELGKRLLRDGHLSPLEHVAYGTNPYRFYENFRGWHQFRSWARPLQGV